MTDVLRPLTGHDVQGGYHGPEPGLEAKSVIIGDNRTMEREMIFRAHGRAVESLKGISGPFGNKLKKSKKKGRTLLIPM